MFQPEDCLSTYSSPHAYCVVYSTADRASFRQAEQSLQALWKTDSIRSKAVILVANKTDLVRSRVVSTQGNIQHETVTPQNTIITIIMKQIILMELTIKP